MKKYLFIWSTVFALCLTSQAKALVCETTPNCDDLNYKLTATEVGNLGTGWKCSACPFDGTKWSCAPLIKEIDPCEGYDLSYEEKSSKGNGWNCRRCPNSENYSIGSVEDRYKCDPKACDPRFSTTYRSSPVCITGPSRQVDVTYGDCGYSFGSCYTRHEIRVDNGCSNTRWINQYSSTAYYATLKDPSRCTSEIFLGQDTLFNPYKEYRCQKGYSGDSPCVSEFSVINYDSRLPEACSMLYSGATPYTAPCQDKGLF